MPRRPTPRRGGPSIRVRATLAWVAALGAWACSGGAAPTSAPSGAAGSSSAGAASTEASADGEASPGVRVGPALFETADDVDPPAARWDMVENLREGRDAPRAASDGGGRAWLVDPPERVRVLERHTFTIVYEAGPLGVAVDGMVFLQPSPFWGWSTPQALYAGLAGYTTATTDAAGVELELETFGLGNDRTDPLGIRITGRALAEGERITIVYGDGPGAIVDRFAERGQRLWISVDGDGDGVRAVLADSPTVDVAAGPAARLVLHGPSMARPGEEIVFRWAALDALGNAGASLTAVPEVFDVPAELELGEVVVAAGGDRGHVTGRVLAPAVSLRFGLRSGERLRAICNPLRVDADRPRVLWADLHGHSHYSDGTGEPADYFRFARDVAALDVVALTDHDHWGVRFVDENPEMWDALRAAANDAHEPGRFVALVGYEWTSWIHGHRHVLSFTDELPLLSSLDDRTTTPAQLWDALRGRDVLTFAHHSAGGPIATNWSFAPDPELEPVTEIMSTHGSSEALDSPRLIYSPRPGNFVRDVLDHGYELGLIGSGDGHDGHPGLAHVGSNPHGGIAAILAEEPTRAAVLEALRARRCYATTGPRIWLDVTLDGVRMGGRVAPAGDGGVRELRIEAVGTAPLRWVDVVRSGEVLARIDVEGRESVGLSWELEGLADGEYVYVRLVQAEDDAAWSSPIFIRGDDR